MNYIKIKTPLTQMNDVCINLDKYRHKKQTSPHMSGGGGGGRGELARLLPAPWVSKES